MNTDIFEIHEGNKYTVEFLTGKPIRFSHKGKHWPLTTQCIIKRNDLIIGMGEAVKHENDTNNLQYGRVYAAKKAFNQASVRTWPELRTRLWKQILNGNTNTLPEVLKTLLDLNDSKYL